MADKQETENLQGYYKVTNHFYKCLSVDGDEGIMKNIPMLGDISLKIEYGDFGEADPQICEATGHSSYNVQLTYSASGEDFTEPGVMTENGRKMKIKQMFGVSSYEQITEEEVKAMEDDCDPIEAPPAPYKLQPENQGKFVWFTGPPGLGKSTTAQLLAINHGYVYYEGDCFGSLKNPYVPLDAESPSLAQVNQKTLKGEGEKERNEFLMKLGKEEGKIVTGDYDKELFAEYIELLCGDIKRERARLGGDWAIANLILNRSFRDQIRSILGPELIIISLSMTMEDQVERLRKRHFGDESAVEMMKKFYNLIEPVGADEENVFDVNVTPDMSPDEVTKKAFEIISNNP